MHHPARQRPPRWALKQLSEEEYLAEWRRPSDDFEVNMADIHHLAMTGKSIIEPMRTRIPTFSWDDILIKGAQLAKMPLNKTELVVTQTLIGPAAAFPLMLETPVFVSHISFGALSREAKLALAKGSTLAKTAMCSGEGGILPESLAASYRYIFEYVPNKYSVTDENLKLADAIAVGTAAMMAAGCQQYRICNTGKCPVGSTSGQTDFNGVAIVHLSLQSLRPLQHSFPSLLIFRQLQVFLAQYPVQFLSQSPPPCHPYDQVHSLTLPDWPHTAGCPDNGHKPTALLQADSEGKKTFLLSESLWVIFPAACGVVLY